MYEYKYYEILNGDICVYFKDGNFIGADYVKCGEWFVYDANEIDDVKYLLNRYGIDLDIGGNNESLSNDSF